MLEALVNSFADKRRIKSIYQLILGYLDRTLSCQHTETTLFSLWYFMVQNYFQDADLDPLYMLLFKKHFATLLALNDDDHIKAAVYILEEHLLIGFVSPQELSQIFAFVEGKYRLAHQFADVLIKEACLNLIATLLLLQLTQSSPAQIYQQYYGCLTLIFKDLADLQIAKTNKDQISFKNQIMTVANRFIILSPQLFTQLLAAEQVAQHEFLAVWLQNMVTIITKHYLSSKFALKINALAILQYLTQLPFTLFLHQFANLIKFVSPQLNIHQQNAQQNKIRDKKISTRKEELRATQQYQDVNIVSLFKDKIQVSYFLFNNLRPIIKKQ